MLLVFYRLSYTFNRLVHIAEEHRRIKAVQILIYKALRVRRVRKSAVQQRFRNNQRNFKQLGVSLSLRHVNVFVKENPFLFKHGHSPPFVNFKIKFRICKALLRAEYYI